MFMPNTTGKLSRKSRRNAYGEYTYLPPKTVQCGMVDNLNSIQKTPVRADSSADRGASEETVAKVKILFLPNVAIAADDKFEFDGLILRVTGIQKRYAVLGGRLDHLEVDMAVWAT